METLDETRAPADSGEHIAGPSSRSSPATLRIAYLLSRYPAVSHTFFLHEVLGLRARGMHIETASINPPDRDVRDLPANESAEAVNTFYLKSIGKLAALGQLFAILFNHPAVVFRGLFTVLRTRNLTLRDRLFWLFYLAEALLLGRWMRKRKLDSLHVHFGGAVATVGMLTHAAWSIPWSITIHGPEELLNTDAYHLREKVLSAKFVFCISDFCRSQLFQLTPPGDWHKFHVIRLGVDPVMLTPHSRAFGSTSGGGNTAGASSGGRPAFGSAQSNEPRTTELVSIGRLVPAKGHRILLDALRIVRDRGTAIHLTLIGGGPDLTGLQLFAQRHKLAVNFTGALSHDQALAHLRRGDIFALASFAEGIPVALMEAMSLGLPCVSTGIAGIPELIRTGVDGLLVPPANPEAFADALESLAADSALRRTLGYSARQRIISQYNLPLNQELLAHSFESLLRPRFARTPSPATPSPTTSTSGVGSAKPLPFRAPTRRPR